MGQLRARLASEEICPNSNGFVGIWRGSTWDAYGTASFGTPVTGQDVWLLNESWVGTNFSPGDNLPGDFRIRSVSCGAGLGPTTPGANQVDVSTTAYGFLNDNVPANRKTLQQQINDYNAANGTSITSGFVVATVNSQGVATNLGFMLLNTYAWWGIVISGSAHGFDGWTIGVPPGDAVSFTETSVADWMRDHSTVAFVAEYTGS